MDESSILLLFQEGSWLMDVIEKEIDGKIYCLDLDEFNLGLPAGTIITNNFGSKCITCSIDDQYNETDYSIRKLIEINRYSGTDFIWVRKFQDKIILRTTTGLDGRQMFLDNIINIVLPKDYIIAQCCLWMNHQYYCCSKKRVKIDIDSLKTYKRKELLI